MGSWRNPQLVELTADDLPHLLTEQERLLLHLEGRVVTLWTAEGITAQCQVSRSQWQELLLLLLAPQGVALEALIAVRYVEPWVVEGVLVGRPSARDELYAAVHQVQSLPGQPGVRRLTRTEKHTTNNMLKGKRGLAGTLARGGFKWPIETLPKRGYVLRREGREPSVGAVACNSGFLRLRLGPRAAAVRQMAGSMGQKEAHLVG
jgi:hypothetical protein